jgi:predicted RNA methylase
MAEANARVQPSICVSDEDDHDGRDVLFSQFIFHFDMLCDARRNAAYDLHIQRAIQRLRDQKAQSTHAGTGTEVDVLDIGTGSGLLALLACKHGADHVTAIETMSMVAAAARANAVGMQQHHSRVDSSEPPIPPGQQVANTVAPSTSCSESCNSQVQIEPNRFRVLEAHSTELGHPSELQFPNDKGADLIVAEILDSDLIGEGAIPTMRHAKQHLAAQGFAALPATSTIWGALVHGPFVDKLNPPTLQHRDTAGYVVFVMLPSVCLRYACHRLPCFYFDKHTMYAYEYI